MDADWKHADLLSTVDFYEIIVLESRRRGMPVES
jgi:hypothetical protein